MSIFDIETAGDTFIISPVRSLGEIEFAPMQIESEKIIHQYLDDPNMHNLIVDCERCDYFGSTALGIFLAWWKKVCSRKGRMIVCNVSEHGREVLEITRLDSLWPICASKKEALDALAN